MFQESMSGLMVWSRLSVCQRYENRVKKKNRNRLRKNGVPSVKENDPIVTNFIRPYLHQFSINSHCLNGYGKPLKRPFDRYQSRFEAIDNGRDIRQINW